MTRDDAIEALRRAVAWAMTNDLPMPATPADARTWTPPPLLVDAVVAGPLVPTEPPPFMRWDLSAKIPGPPAYDVAGAVLVRFHDAALDLWTWAQHGQLFGVWNTRAACDAATHRDLTRPHDAATVAYHRLVVPAGSSAGGPDSSSAPG
jgi:hypothetical protein